jgi:hypothetical protein
MALLPRDQDWIQATAGWLQAFSEGPPPEYAVAGPYRNGRRIEATEPASMPATNSTPNIAAFTSSTARSVTVWRRRNCSIGLALSVQQVSMIPIASVTGVVVGQCPCLTIYRVQ